VSDWDRWARVAVDDAITTQGKALVAGDEAAYEAIADPSNSALVTLLQNRYDSLRAMGLGIWRQTLQGGIQDTGGRQWSANLHIQYCFGDPTCLPADVMETSSWQMVGNHLVLTTLAPSQQYGFAPRPWEFSKLVVRAGKRVVVVATQANAWRLAQAVVDADRAAVVADQFAKWNPPPSRYVISFATGQEWSTWYGHTQANWAAAWTVPVADLVSEVMVRSDVVAQSELLMLLTHEMTHVTTLAGKRAGDNVSAWWLIEGIAEYTSHLGQPFTQYDGFIPTKDFVAHSWDGNPAVAPPDGNASDVEAAGRYGVAYLSVRRIAERYGQDRMLDFWGRVVHDAQPIDDAARAALGVPWTTVRADCASYVRAQARL
jgi:hypothetical protein